MLCFSAVLSLATGAAFAQHTTAQSNGANGKIERDFDAAGKVIEIRTIGPDGKLQQKIAYEYLSGYYSAQQTATTYWPDGKVRKSVRTTCDESSNFTGEFSELFDESGTQIAGHHLTYDPWTGIYRCSEWQSASKTYKPVECPAAEEEGSKTEARKQFTYDEVMKHLATARKAAALLKPTQSDLAQSPALTRHEIGLIFPAQAHPGERVSGIVVEDPSRYEEMPELAVTRIAFPFENSSLSGWLFEAPGEKPQPADEPITLLVPRHASSLHVTLQKAADPTHPVSANLNFAARPGRKPNPAKSFQSAPLCLKAQLCAVSGPFDGDSRNTFAAFDDAPATIVAETPNAAYLTIPDSVPPGARSLFLTQASKVAAFSVVVGEFAVHNNGRELKSGENLLLVPTLDGPGDLSDDGWQPGNFPSTNLSLAQTLIPGFRLSKARTKITEGEEHEASERDKIEAKKRGEILLVIKNVTPSQISLRGSTDQMLIFHLSEPAFQRGDFKYNLLVETKESGKIEVKGYVIPFLAPIAGQQFDTPSGAH